MDVSEIVFSIRAFVGEAKLSKEEFEGLEMGDVIMLNQSVESPFRVCLGENRHLLGYGGVKQHQKAIKIEKFS